MIANHVPDEENDNTIDRERGDCIVGFGKYLASNINKENKNNN